MLERFGDELRHIRAKTPLGVVKHARKHWRNDLVLELLNLRGPNCEPFWKSRLAPTIRESDEELLRLRDQLRKMFACDTGSSYIPETLNRWLRWQPAGSEPISPFVLNWHWRELEPNPANLRISLAKGVTEVFGKVGCCENPECLTYFLKAKKKYRVCDRPACQIYAQRKYKREWWAKHGHARRVSLGEEFGSVRTRVRKRKRPQTEVQEIRRRLKGGV